MVELEHFLHQGVHQRAHQGVLARARWAAESDAKKKAVKTNLMNTIFEFATKDIKSDTTKVIKIAGRLENPNSYKDLIKIINETNGDDKIKANLIKSIKKECSTFFGGLNPLCKYKDPASH